MNNPIGKFMFSKQQLKALLIYIFGDFTDLNFGKDKGLFISLEGTPMMLDSDFTDEEWLTLKNLCKL